MVDLFTNNLNMDGSEEDQDLQGRTYEYCIAQFAAKKGKGGGEFYTPGCVVRTLVEVLKPFENCRIYDPYIIYNCVVVSFLFKDTMATILFLMKMKKEAPKGASSLSHTVSSPKAMISL